MERELKSESGQSAGRLGGKRLVLAALVASSAFVWTSSANATLTLEVFDNLVAVPGNTIIGPGTLSFSGSDASFTSVVVNVTGVPALPSPNHRTMVDATSAAGIVGRHGLAVFALQLGFISPAGTGMITETFDGLAGFGLIRRRKQQYPVPPP